MKRKIIYILSGMFFLFSCSPTYEAETLLADILGEDVDSLSFDEIKQLISVSYERYSMSGAFLEDGKKLRKYKPEEERYEEKPLLLPRPYPESTFRKGFTVHQDLSYPYSVLKIDSELKERMGENISYILDKVYYDDGTSDSIGVEISSLYRLGLRKVDSITFTVNYEAVIQMRGIEINPDRKEIGYRTGYIRLDKIKHNYASFCLDSCIMDRFLSCQTETHSGKIPQKAGYISGYLPPAKMKRKYRESLRFLEKMVKGIEENKYENKEELLSALTKEVSKVSVPEDSGKYYHSEYFHGNVKTVIVYLAEKRKTENFTYTVHVDSEVEPYNLVWDKKENRQLIVDGRGGTVLAPAIKGLSQINGYYFRLLNYYDDMILLLNPMEARLDTLKPYRSSNISYLTDELVCLSYHNRKCILDKYGNEMTPLIYDKIRTDADGGLIVASSENGFVLFDKHGKQLFKGEGSIGEFSDGLALYRNPENNPVGFIDKSGKLAFTLGGYQEVRAFSGGLAVMKKNDKWGAVGKDGKVAIPFMYDEMEDFLSGVTLISKYGWYGLIGIDNEFIFPLQEMGEHSISEDSGKRFYHLGRHTYDEHGRYIE